MRMRLERRGEQLGQLDDKLEQRGMQLVKRGGRLELKQLSWQCMAHDEQQLGHVQRTILERKSNEKSLKEVINKNRTFLTTGVLTMVF